MILWKDQPLDEMSRKQLQSALQDSVSEIIRLRDAFNPNQFFFALVTGFLLGAITASLAVAVSVMAA